MRVGVHLALVEGGHELKGVGVSRGLGLVGEVLLNLGDRVKECESVLLRFHRHLTHVGCRVQAEVVWNRKEKRGQKGTWRRGSVVWHVPVLLGEPVAEDTTDLLSVENVQIFEDVETDLRRGNGVLGCWGVGV